MAVFLTNLVVTAPATAGGNGQVTFDVTSTTGSYSASLTQGGAVVNAISGATPATDVMLNSVTGNVLLTVSDLAVGGQTLTQTVTVPAYTPPPVLGCTDPAADNYDPNATQENGSCAYTPPPRTPLLRFSPAQSLRFTQPGNPELTAYDNTPFADQQALNHNNPGYCQLFERADTVVVQFGSNYTGVHSLSVIAEDGGAVVLSVAPTKVVQGAGVSEAFPAYARREIATGKTRIYFNDNTLPLPFAIGSRVTLANAPGLNGTYPVGDIREDAAAGVPYLLLAVPYPGGAQRIDLDLTTPYALQAFDTWQAVVPFSSVPMGCHRVRVRATDADFGTATAFSEPLSIATTHRDTVVVTYRNFDNAFGLNYTVGLVNYLRVVGSFFGQDNPTQKTTLRESTGRLTLVSADMQRRITLKVYQQPDWMQEKLAVAFCHDLVRVNGLKGIAGEDYSYPPTPAYALSNGTVQVEQEDFLGAGNRDDVGDVDGGPFLLVDNKFLAINP